MGTQYRQHFEKWKMLLKGKNGFGAKVSPCSWLCQGERWHLWAEVDVLFRPGVGAGSGHWATTGVGPPGLLPPAPSHWALSLSRKTRHLPGPHSLSSTARRTSPRPCRLCPGRPPSSGTLPCGASSGSRTRGSEIGSRGSV